MATHDKRYLCSDLVPGDVNTCQQFTNHCGNKGSIYWIAIFGFLRCYDDLMNSHKNFAVSKFTFYAFKGIHQEDLNLKRQWKVGYSFVWFVRIWRMLTCNFSSTLCLWYVRNTKPSSLTTSWTIFPIAIEPLVLHVSVIDFVSTHAITRLS